MMALKTAPLGINSGSSTFTHARSVAHTALQRLHASPYRGLRSVELDVNGNTMVLSGQVKTFFLKQMAQHLLGDYSSSWEIKNNLRVA